MKHPARRTAQTHNVTKRTPTHDVLHDHKQAKTGKKRKNYKENATNSLKQSQEKKTINNRSHDRETNKQTKKKKNIDAQTLRTIEPQVPAASPTHAAKPEKQRYMASIQQQEKGHVTKSVWMKWVNRPEETCGNKRRGKRKRKNSKLSNTFSIIQSHSASHWGHRMY